jgi:hypothetical protein
MKCEYSLCGLNGKANASLDGTLYNLNAYYLISSFKTIIFPGVYVMNDAEVNNLKQWFNTVPDAKIISMEGGLGRLRADLSDGEDRLRDLFGMTGKAKSVQSNYNITLTISRSIDHIINKDYTNFYSTSTLNPKIKLFTRIGRSYYWPAVDSDPNVHALGSFQIQGEGTNYPALVVKKVTSTAYTFVFNFDPTIYQQLNATKGLKALTTSLHTWMVLGRYINKLEWQLRCTNNGALVAGTRRVIQTGSGSVVIPVKLPSALPCAASAMEWRGYMYPWETPASTVLAAKVAWYSSKDASKTLFKRSEPVDEMTLGYDVMGEEMTYDTEVEFEPEAFVEGDVVLEDLMVDEPFAEEEMEEEVESVSDEEVQQDEEHIISNEDFVELGEVEEDSLQDKQDDEEEEELVDEDEEDDEDEEELVEEDEELADEDGEDFQEDEPVEFEGPLEEEEEFLEDGALLEEKLIDGVSDE